MIREPLLASRRVPGAEYGHKRDGVMLVHGGLHMIGGNSAPYFTITNDVHQAGYPNRSWSGGAAHEEILRYWPKFADIVALHLSDIDGAPMHGVANGWYDLAGALGGAGETFHRGNSETYGRLDVSRAGCLQLFADHFRITIEAVSAIHDEFEINDIRGEAAKARLAEIADGLRPMWKQQADDCIDRHGLRVFGDPWPVAV
jgi:hypothetical protein